MVGRAPERRVDLNARLTRNGPRKLLAIDGGRIRGVLSLKNRAEIEQLLIKESKRADYRLADYLDLAWSTGPRTQAHMSVRATAPELWCWQYCR